MRRGRRIAATPRRPVPLSSQPCLMRGMRRGTGAPSFTREDGDGDGGPAAAQVLEPGAILLVGRALALAECGHRLDDLPAAGAEAQQRALLLEARAPVRRLRRDRRPRSSALHTE